MNVKNLVKFSELKSKYNSVILFRCGDYYAAYGEDAEFIARITAIELQEYNEHGITCHYAEFMHYFLDSVLPKIVRAGEKVVIVDDEK